MFGLFKKKEAPKSQEPLSTRDEAFQALSGRFAPQELTILAVTGPNGFAGDGEEDGGTFTASIGLTAWMEEDSPEIHQEEIRLTTPADQRLLGFLRQRAGADFIIKFHARLSLDQTELLLLDLPTPAFDPDLKAILEQQKKPDSTYVEGIGTFVLNRQVKWYEAEVDWLEGKIRLDFDQGPQEEMKAAQETARVLLDNAADWDSRVRAYAAQELLEAVNQSVLEQDAEDEQAVPATQEEFAQRLELDAVQADKDGGFTFWFNDGEEFWGRSIQVRGSLTAGPTLAQMEE